MHRIDNLYSLEDQIDILWRIGEIKGGYEKAKTQKKCQRYFKALAEKCDLAARTACQLEQFRPYPKILATIADIAGLFGVSRSTVQRYLYSSPYSEDLKNFESLCRQQGSKRGGQNGSTKGYKQKRTWSRRKK